MMFAAVDCDRTSCWVGLIMATLGAVFDGVGAAGGVLAIVVGGAATGTGSILVTVVLCWRYLCVYDMCNRTGAVDD